MFPTALLHVLMFIHHHNHQGFLIMCDEVRKLIKWKRLLNWFLKIINRLKSVRASKDMSRCLQLLKYLFNRSYLETSQGLGPKEIQFQILLTVFTDTNHITFSVTAVKQTKIVTTTFINVSILLRVICNLSVQNKQQITVNICCAFVGQIQ
jgi:hypothetical protein